MGKIQVEGPADLRVLFGDLGSVCLLLLRQALGLVLVQPGVHLIDIRLDLGGVLQCLLHQLHPALGVIQQLVAGYLHRQRINILGRRLAVLYDKKLAAVGVGTGIGHAQRPAEVVQFAAALILKFFPVYTLAARAGAGRVAALDHKIFDDPVEDQPVVVAVFGVG